MTWSSIKVALFILDGGIALLRQRPWLVLMTLLFTLALSFSPFVGPARADNGLLLSTAFPGIEAQPGETVTFPLELRNSGVPQKVDLKVVSAPKEWQTLFKGGGMIVTQAFAGNDKPASVDFQVEVPETAQPGSYNFVVQAAGPGATSRLGLQVVIKEVATGSDKMTTDYPVLSGTSSTSFQFRVDLTNNGAQERSYSLAAQAPPGWQVTFSPAYDSKQIASLSLKPGKSQGLDVTVKPPQGVKAGTYNIPIQATSGSSKAGVVLKVNITGNYSLELTTPSGRLNADAIAGKESPVTLVVKNTGSADLANITFAASAATGWAVTFKPEKIDLLPAGASQQVTAFIKPSPKAIAGDYVVILSANTQEASGSADFRVSVRTSTLWGLVGVILVLIVIGAVGWTFRKYGRR
ncbi:Immunoglobulin-like fold [Moorella glycerini]|uniref:NPCBM-associated, NEW3 domain of alpha-galactosidase n=1 Tax=Neomoorella stamsii TaxID=1266720 RepID=A0A9X7J0V9_9FIRM|nr:NPCBM-associated, NEW3 domain of alpha-galactosidase [Moorella stamsii]CEP66405.1 Immunoglobulin-like fold [Moorella glycerini]